MMYQLISKDHKRQPLGVYTDNGWKEQIAEECYHQCVYCAINEQHWGGIDHYHIDHFRPKSIEKFKSLENDICNLFYACPVCNRFKSDSWPADPDLNVPSFPDPSVTDYSTIFETDSDALLISRYVAARYLIEKLYLNRPQLIYERRESLLRKTQSEISTAVHELLIKVLDMENPANKDLIKKTLSVMSSIRNHLAVCEYIRPYKIGEIRKS
jgi:5-methylcytosine-specific restriction endonuclease McrA